MGGSCLGVSVGAAHVSGLVGGVVEIGVVPAGPEVLGGRCRLSDAPQHLVETASVGSGAVGPAAEVWVEGGDRRSVLAVGQCRKFRVWVGRLILFRPWLV